MLVVYDKSAASRNNDAFKQEFSTVKCHEFYKRSFLIMYKLRM